MNCKNSITIASAVSICAIVVFGGISTELMAQSVDFKDDYTPLKAEGQIPDEFLMLSKQKYERALERQVSRKEKRKVRKAKEEFLLSSNYQINNLLMNGKVLFGDPVTRYINRVAHEVLKSEPELQNKLTFYAVKSPSVNAFATNQGYIFVNLGLIAQVQNEAQLAYILAHEITHYAKKHVISSYVERSQISKSREFKDLRSFDKIALLSDYSKEKEFEADREGLKRILNTNYSIDEAFGIFDVLQYSYLPYDEVEFDKTFFNEGDYILPQEYFNDTIRAIRREDDYDDSKSTHPNIRKRRDHFYELAVEEDTKKGVEFIVSEEEFYRVREIARLEISNLYLMNRDYAEAIYNAYLNLKTYPDNKYARTVLGKALYMTAKYKNENSTYEVLDDYEDIEGQSRRVHYFLDKIPAEELAILACKYLWDTKQKYGNSKALELFGDDALRSLVFDHKLKKRDFNEASKAELLSEIENDEEEQSDDGNLSKYDKIKKQKTVENIEGYHHYAFTNGIIQDEKFSAKFEKYAKEYSREEAEKNDDDLTWKEKLEKKAEQQKENGTVEFGKRKLGIDKVVAVDPFYVSVDMRGKKDPAIMFIKSEDQQIKFNDKIRYSAKAAKLNCEIIDTKNMSNADTDHYNDLAFLNQWITERLEHKNMNILMSQCDRVQGVVDYYDTKYFYYTGVLNGKVRPKNLIWKVIATIPLVYTIPYGVYLAVQNYQKSWHYNYLFNLETGNAYMADKTTFDSDSGDKLDAVIYDALYQISKEK